MKRSIETGDLRQMRMAAKQCAHRREIVRLMQGRERNEALQGLQHFVAHQRRRAEDLATMNHAMTDRIDSSAIEPPVHELEELGRRMQALSESRKNGKTQKPAR